MSNSRVYTNDYELLIPELKSNPARKPVRKNVFFGDIEDCFNGELLCEYGLNSISFDFFINWGEKKQSGELVEEVWFKRIMKFHGNEEELCTNLYEPSEFITRLIQLEGIAEIDKKRKFLNSYGLTGKYTIIRDFVDFLTYDEKKYPILAMLDLNRLENIKLITLTELKSLLYNNSGGGFNMLKPLYYSNTRLESFLAAPEASLAPWPGDCDMILFNDECKCKCIIEFKKHTDRSTLTMQDQSFDKYAGDRNKYKRLGILRDYLSSVQNEVIPYIVVFYPTNNEKNIKIQSIEGMYNNLKSSSSELYISIPENHSVESLNKFKRELLEKIIKI